MELHRIARATGKTKDTGGAEYWLTDVHEYEDLLGFEIPRRQASAQRQFLYQDRAGAEVARAAMFKVLGAAVSVSFGLPEL